MTLRSVALFVLCVCAVAAQTLSAQFQDRFVTVNGLRLHYLDWGGAEKPPFIMLHGIARHAHTFDHIAADLARDYRVIAVDMRGHGDSAWSPDAAYMVEDYVKDLDRKSTRLNSSHRCISYAVFCLKKKKKRKSSNTTRL